MLSPNEIIAMLMGLHKDANNPLATRVVMRIAANEIERLRKERDEARLQTRRILNEIDCRIENGADSNGHLEAIRNLFKEDTNDR